MVQRFDMVQAPDPMLVEAIRNNPRRYLPRTVATLVKTGAMTRREIADTLEEAFADADNKELTAFVAGLSAGLRA